MTIKVGSDAHKELFCRQFLETHELLRSRGAAMA